MSRLIPRVFIVIGHEILLHTSCLLFVVSIQLFFQQDPFYFIFFSFTSFQFYCQFLFRKMMVSKNNKKILIRKKNVEIYIMSWSVDTFVTICFHKRMKKELVIFAFFMRKSLRLTVVNKLFFPLFLPIICNVFFIILQLIKQSKKTTSFILIWC